MVVFLLAPPREGRPYQVFVDLTYIEISTRAPTGGATYGLAFTYDADDYISTRAPTGGATLSMAAAVLHKKFLLAPPREGRLQFSTKLMLCFVENCRKITRFFTRYSPYVREIFQKAAKIKRIFARTFREIMYGKGRR